MDVQELIKRFISSNYTTNVSADLKEVICQRKEGFVDVVACLEVPLTSTDACDRAAGVQLLADLLHLLPNDWLDEDQLNYVSSFFVQRFKDHHTVLPPAIHASVALLQQDSISKSDVEKLIRALFLDVHCQSQLMNVRRNVYYILRLCVTQHANVVENMFPEFAVGFISAAEGERDPRNLLVIFSMIPRLAVNSKIGHLLEDLFELAAAYFPIDYVSPAHDATSISAEDLVLSLRQCLSCTASWSQFFIPLAIEKIESSLTSAKLDSYRTLSACCSNYTFSNLEKHMLQVWQCVRRDILETSPGSELSVVALQCLSEVTAAFNRELTSIATRDSFYNTVLQECCIHVSAPEGKLWEPAVLLAAAVVREDSSSVLSDQLLPLACQQIERRCNLCENEQASVNSVIILKILLQATTRFASADGESNALSSELQKRCFTAVSLALQSDSDLVSVEAVNVAIVFSKYYRKHWGDLARSILMKVLKKGSASTIHSRNFRAAAVDALTVPSSQSCSLLQENVFSLIECGHFDNSPDMPVELAVVASLSCDDNASKLSLKKLWDVFKESRSIAVCHCISKVISTSKSPIVHDFVLNGLQLIPGLLVTTLQYMLLSESKHDFRAENTQLFHAVSDTLYTFASSSSEASVAASKFALTMSRALLNQLQDPEEMKFGIDLQGIFIRDNTFPYPMNKENCTSYSAVTLLMQGLLQCCRDVNAVALQCLEPLLWWSCDPLVAEAAHLAAAQTIASLLNKTEGAISEECERSCREYVVQQLKEEVRERQEAAIILLGWGVTALYMRGSPHANIWQDMLENLLWHSDLGLEAAKCYSIIFGDHPRSLSGDSFANVKLLYKQRVFHERIEAMLENIKDCAEDSRHQILLALTAVLDSLPHCLLQAHMSKLVTVLVEGVRSTQSPTVVAGAISTLLCLLSGHSAAPAELSPYTGTLVDGLLVLATSNGFRCPKRKARNGQEIESVDVPNKEAFDSLFNLLLENDKKIASTPASSVIIDGVTESTQKHQPVSVREQSLQCLKLLASLPAQHCLPYKDQVVRELKSAVADHKRVVRAAAADARVAWMQVGT